MVRTIHVLEDSGALDVVFTRGFLLDLINACGIFRGSRSRSTLRMQEGG